MRGAQPAAVAVLDPWRLYVSDGRTLALRGAETTAGALYELARTHGLRQIWITPAGASWLGLPAELPRGDEAHPFLEHGALGGSAGQEVLRDWLTYWTEGERGSAVDLAFPLWDRSSPWHGLTWGPSLLGELVTFMEATGGMLWRRSGAITSDAWLRSRWWDNLAPTEYPEELAGAANLEADLILFRRLTDRERRARYVVGFDVNAMYLAAASSLALPVGAHERHQAPAAALGFPGYFRTGDRWVTQPTARFEDLRAVDECVIWRTSHRFLEPWYRCLRDARTALLEEGGAALEAVKQVYRLGIGRLGSTRRSLSGDPLYQPYWRHAVMGEARSRLLRRVHALPRPPLAIDRDALYFATDSLSPETLAGRLGLEISPQAGKFKVLGLGRLRAEVPVGAAGKPRRLLEVLEDPTTSTTRAIDSLRKVVRSS